MTKETQKPQLNIPVVMHWVFAENNPPEIDETDKWNKEDRISKDVLTISEYGLKWGRFYHRSGNWSIDGILTGKKIMPQYWAYVVLPCA